MSAAFTAHVLGPRELDLPLAPHHAASPGRVLLAVAAFPHRLRRAEVRSTVLKALNDLDTERIRRYTDWLDALAFGEGGRNWRMK